MYQSIIVLVVSLLTTLVRTFCHCVIHFFYLSSILSIILIRLTSHFLKILLVNELGDAKERIVPRFPKHFSYLSMALLITSIRHGIGPKGSPFVPEEKIQTIIFSKVSPDLPILTSRFAAHFFLHYGNTALAAHLTRTA